MKDIEDLSSFAKKLGYKEVKNFTAIVYNKPRHERYKCFTIPKKAGGSRVIHAPEQRLKLLQKRMSQFFTKHYEEKIKEYKKSVSHAFRKKYSIETNAYIHRNKRYVFNIDLKDFFPSISLGRIYNFFQKDKYFSFSQEIAKAIAVTACYKNKLPQGSPLSPVISNVLGHILDIKLVKLAKKYKCSYSRYADDITFSTNQKNFPSALAQKCKEDSNVWICEATLEDEVAKARFQINQSKISMQYKMSRQMVTGLVVNKYPNVQYDYYKKARAMVHSLITKGLYHVDKEKTQEGTLKQLEGILSFIYCIKVIMRKKRINKQYLHESISWGIRSIYKEFLVHKYLCTIEKPLVITEGKTDPIYLKKAMDHLRIDKASIQFLRKSKNFTSLFLNKKGNNTQTDEQGGKNVLRMILNEIQKVHDKKLCRNEKDKEKKKSGHAYSYSPFIFLFDYDAMMKEDKKDSNSQKWKHNFANVYSLFIGDECKPNIETVLLGKKAERLLEAKKKSINALKLEVNKLSKNNFTNFKTPFFEKIKAIKEDCLSK